MTTNTSKRWTILVIDNNADAVRFLHDMLDSKPYNIVTTSNGEEGFNLLLQNSDLYSLIILGQNIEDINGVRLLHKINSCSVMKTIPIIMEASTGTLEEMEICIRAGARYYISKPIDKQIIPHIISTALRDQERYSIAEKAVLASKPMHTLTNASFRLQTLPEAQVAANLIANECPNPRLAAVGITEMLINAIEHGNLGISYAEKTALHENETWLSEIERRLALSENADKYVTLMFNKSESHINIRIIDQGLGFDWREFQEIDSHRVFDNHGRGIVMARTLAFESLIYHGCGNDVECIIPL